MGIGRIDTARRTTAGYGTEKVIAVYIASPYTKGNQAENVRAQIDAYAELLKAGYLPFAPLMAHFIELVHPQEYETWIAVDLAWIDRCDVVLRLPGESPGADREMEYANKRGKKVVTRISDISALWGPL